MISRRSSTGPAARDRIRIDGPTARKRAPPDREPTGGVSTMPAPTVEGNSVSALYVTGPGGGGRYLLLEELVTIGRGASANVVIDDPRVSRVHAALEIGEAITVTDLASANGTVRGGRRLRPHQPCPVGVDEPLFIGDSTLVVRRTSLRRRCPQLITRLDEARARAPQNDTGLILTVVRPSQPAQRKALEVTLAETLIAPSDWLTWLDRGKLLLGVGAKDERAAIAFQAAVARLLATWGIVCDVEARFFSRPHLDSGGWDLERLLGTPRGLTFARGTVVIEHPSMAALKAVILRVAPTSVNVLILGETGVGKDVIASMVHELSPRSAQPFVRLNCASIPEPLLESELFGHESGAFTGATGAKPGLIEAAHQGTVFLDEIGDMPSSLQAKLLRAIESREVLRIGGLRPRLIDVRFVAATNRDLAADVGAGRFRQDLLYRLNTITVIIPPLRERGSEIAPLARLFLTQACDRFSLSGRELSDDTLGTLERYSWPGNVRELRNVMERGALLTPETVIEPHHLGLPDTGGALSSGLGPVAHLGRETASPARGGDQPAAERDKIEHALRMAGGNQTSAAAILGIPRRTLVRRIARLGLPRPRTPGRGPPTRTS